MSREEARDDVRDWPTLMREFERIVDLPVAEREAAIAAAALPRSLERRLRELLAADCDETFLLPGTALRLPTSPAAPAAGEGADDVMPHRLGRFEPLALLGRGSMGVVYRALDTALDRHIAVKLMTRELAGDAEWLARFRREARAAAGLNHPNVLTIHDVGEQDGVPYLATELIEGQTLRARLRRGPVPTPEAVALFRQITGAVAAAHAVGILHRDLKPENVMVRADGLVKVLDFGLARSVDTEARGGGDATATGRGLLLGTIGYLSPEQARGTALTPASDVFALGVMLYELLTGAAPFARDNSVDTLVAVLEHRVTDLASVAPHVPKPLAKLTMRAMAPTPELRPRDAGELLRELDTALRADAQDPAADELPEVRYARSGDVNIAYQVFGDGPRDVVFVMGWISHLEYFWREPSFARFLRRIGTFARVILFDKRGTGLSDRVDNDDLPTLEQRMDDVRAVMNEVGSERAVLIGVSEGGPMSCLFAASYPERTLGLVMIGSYARRLRTDDYPWGPTPQQREAFLEVIRNQWGGPVGIDERAPSAAGDPRFRSWWAAYLRHGASPAAAVALTRMNSEIDVRQVLGGIRVPTLVVHRTEDRCLVVEEGRYLARHIPGARMVELPGADHLPFVGDQDAILEEIARFLAELTPAVETESIVATALACEPGRTRLPAAAAREMDSAIRAQRGTVVAQAGQPNVIAVFDGPARAVRAAMQCAAIARRHGTQPGFGLHIGECQIGAHDGPGVAGEVAAAVAHRSASGQVLVTRTVRDLVAGSGLVLEPHDTLDHPLLGPLPLLVVVSPTGG